MIDVSSEILIWYVWATAIIGGLTALGLLIWFMIWVWDHTLNSILVMFKIKMLFAEFMRDHYRGKQNKREE
ncbi:hypothetical protein [Paenibacillus sp. TCA20]|uniref:hypothetical protein n=1 Tax=Paenibacillus sp. TCA20 TaxID=1499968 RepID=UPI00064C4CF0|nr:hypothetical protein [Paenibacillus sp. TCA20]